LSEESPKHFGSASQWRSWLGENHTEEEAIWVVVQKKGSRRPGIRYEEAVLEAVAHGWIDGRMKRLNEDEFMQRFTPRRRDSIWSWTNRERAERLISEDRMAPEGLRKVEEAKENGRWENATSSRKREVETPDDLAGALGGNDLARGNFESFPPSARYMYIHWINEAKRPETRERRIRTVVDRSEGNLKPGIDLRVSRD
jgi:uncharacterized protein YdeI (YjbR/CyaY-like superfamily)